MTLSDNLQSNAMSFNTIQNDPQSLITVTAYDRPQVAEVILREIIMNDEEENADESLDD